MILLLMSLFGPADGNYFKERSRVKLALDDNFYSHVIDLWPAKGGGYYLITNSSHQRFDTALFKVSSDGQTLIKFDKQGQGPGELRQAAGIIEFEGKVYVGERISPLVHVYDTDLKSIKDIKTSRGGQLAAVTQNHVGIWNTHHKADNKCYMFAMFPKHMLYRIHYSVALKIDELPFLIQSWGDVCSLGEGRYAAITANRYQIHLFSEQEMEAKELFKREPVHIIPYHPYEGDQGRIGTKANEWMFSFTKFSKIYHENGTLYVCYNNRKEEFFLDILSVDGTFLKKKIPMGNRNPLSFHDGAFTSIEKNEDGDENIFFVVTEEVIH